MLSGEKTTLFTFTVSEGEVWPPDFQPPCLQVSTCALPGRSGLATSAAGTAGAASSTRRSPGEVPVTACSVLHFLSRKYQIVGIVSYGFGCGSLFEGKQ